MTEKKHTVVFMFGGIKTTAMWTQAELAKNLTKPDMELISVNATPNAGYRRKRTEQTINRIYKTRNFIRKRLVDWPIN